ncbi:ABC transporter permease [Fusibacter ferrireducens]|uniref:ABC transporter permease n=1 Tax=Fusibacter ferrireducens TaxID=2785058 RepID=A0ABR9ZS22_9FIRM|nr:ABC transporter permease [Fusibacter ferrireducens]MBF4693263.1 ABC transporter permease [Fusibacter ferrireducens]
MKYIIKRLLGTIPIVIGVSLLLYIMLNIVPGDPVALMMGEHVNADTIERVRARMNLDDPLLVRFSKYVLGAFKGDLGYSYKLKREVSTLIWKAFPNTAILAVAGALVSWMIGIPAGVISAVRKNTAVDYGVMTFALIGVSMPVFWSGLLFQYLFGLKLKWLPISGFDGLNIKYIVMPAIVLGWSSAATIARLTRSSLLEVMSADYIRTAREKGLLRYQVIMGHALKNAFLPVLTVMTIQIASLLSGAVITETIFGIPGIGRIAVSAIQTRDMPLLQGSVMFTTILIILGNLVADVLYSFIDPRIKYN